MKATVENGSNGVVVIFTWSSINDDNLMNFVDLCSSLGWNSLLCLSNFLSAFYPQMSLSLAFHLVLEFIEELNTRPCHIIFLAFSGAPKACIYKVIMGDCEAQIHPDDHHKVDFPRRHLIENGEENKKWSNREEERS